MALIRPRLNDYHDLPFTQEQVSFAIPYLDEDIPLYVDPFLLWKSPSMQDTSLHTALVASFNHFGQLALSGRGDEAADALIRSSECAEVGLGSAVDKQGRRIESDRAKEILELFRLIPQVRSVGFMHVEEVQLYVDQVSKDRISDITCSLLKSFLIDFTIDQCQQWRIPTKSTSIEVFNYTDQRFVAEHVSLPLNPVNDRPLLLVPKRWLRFTPWINYDDYFEKAFVPANQDRLRDRVRVLQYNRHNYDVVTTYVKAKERTSSDCKNDPLFRPLAITSAKGKLRQIVQLPTGKTRNADTIYEDLIAQLMASLMYPHLDFAQEQSRTDSNVQIRDLIFYNNRSVDFLRDIYDLYGSRQIVMEIKNVAHVEREHLNQLNRYLADQFGHFGVIVTRHKLPPPIWKNTIDLWSGQRRCIIAITDEDLDIMVDVFESKQREPIEVLKRAYIEFTRSCPA